MRAFALPVHIHSVDLNMVTDMVMPGVTFHRGDANQLSGNLSPDFMRGLARPLMVIEDFGHQKETTLAVLNFFHQWLLAGEYVIIEDGIITELGLAETYKGGPGAALEEFLDRHPTGYEIAT